MAPKVPSDKALERALEDAVQSIFDSDERGELTVNYVRQVAEKKLGLVDGFFKSDDWKARSKEVALKAVDKAETEALSSQQSTGPPKPDSEDAESEPTPRPKPKAKAKQKDKPEPKPKPKPKPRSKPTKKRKAAASDDESESVSSDLSDASGSNLSDASDSDDSSSAESTDTAPKRKRTQPKAVARGKKRKPTDEEDDDDDDSSASDSEPKHPKKKAKSEDKPKPSPKKKGKQKEKTPVSEPASGSQSSLSDAPTRETAEPEAEAVPVAKVDTPVDEESEMSEVFDEPPKRKGKGAKAAKGEPKIKKEPKAKAKTDKADFSPKGSLIRQLQMQLNKCGVRKVWGVLLKKYGDDKSAKIQHLKGMLSEVGMTGRFSESKAKEIKERRELEADLGEVIEGENNWGFTASARPTRRGAAAAKARKVSSSESGDEGEDPGGARGGTSSGQSDDDGSDDDDGQTKPRTRGPAKHRAALAFLGTDSESE